MLIVSAPPSVLSPKTGFDPGSNCIDATPFFGSRSQLTTSANASLMRTPSWNTDRPCGVPEERRRREAAEAHVGLIGIAGGRIERHAVRVEIEKLGDAAGALPVELAGAEGLHVGGNLLERRAEPWQRRRADDLDGGERDDRRRLTRGACRRAGEEQQQTSDQAAITGSRHPKAARRRQSPRSSRWLQCRSPRPHWSGRTRRRACRRPA